MVIHHPPVTRLAYVIERRVPALGRHGVTALMVEIGLLFVVLAGRDIEGLIVGTGATLLPALVRIVHDESQHRREAELAATADLRIAGDARQLMHMPLQLRDLALYLADWEPTTLAKLAESSRAGTLQQTIAIGSEGHALERAVDQRWNWFANATSPYLPTASRRARALVHDALDALARAFQVTGALNMLNGSIADVRTARTKSSAIACCRTLARISSRSSGAIWRAKRSRARVTAAGASTAQRSLASSA